METRYKIIKTIGEVKQLIKACKTTGYCSNDFETNADPLYVDTFKPTLLSISFMPGFGCAIPLDHFQTRKYCGKNWNWREALDLIGHQLIENPKIVKAAWNFKFDGQIWEKYGIYYRGVLLDGMLMKYLLNEERPHGLKDAVRRYLPEHGDYEKAEKFEKIPWDQKELEPLSKYGCQDTDYTLRLCIFFEHKLMTIDSYLYRAYRNLFSTASRVLTSVEKTGLVVDRGFNNYLLESYKAKIDEAQNQVLALRKVQRAHTMMIRDRIDEYLVKIQTELDELDYDDPKDARKIALREEKITNVRAGVYTTKTEQELIAPLNLNSTLDLIQLMYTHRSGFKFPIIKQTESGKPSTDEDTLIKLRTQEIRAESEQAIFLDNLLLLRGLEKMYKTYIVGWNEKVQDDSRLHGRINITGTDSNRYSSAEPNIQQIPKTSVDPNIKKQLIAPEGMLYLAYDYSQAELRMMAHLSGDETYLSAFREGTDPHLTIAAKKYGVPIEEATKIYEDEEHPDYPIWKVRRKQAKQIAFGLIYGIGPQLLAEKLSDPKSGLIVDKEGAKKEMDIFFGQHPKILKYKEKQERFIKKNGFYRQMFGTKRRLPQIWGDDKELQAYALRLGLNFPCLTPDTQALCRTKGWVNYKKLEEGDKILAFNPDTGQSEWQKVQRVNEFIYEGNLIRFYNRNVDILSTPDHRWLVMHSKNPNLKKTKVLTSADIYHSKKCHAIPIKAPHTNYNIKPEISDNQVAFLGWYLTDGKDLGKRIRIFQSQSANPQKVEIIDGIINKFSVKFSRRVSKNDEVIWESSDEYLLRFLSWYAPDRKLTMFLLSKLTNPQLQILLHNMRLGDGWSVFATGDKKQAELVQALVVLCGESSSMYILSKEGDISYFKDHKPSKTGQKFVRATKTSYGIKFSKNKLSVHTANTRKTENNCSLVPYNGTVWCPTVPSGAFFIRYKGENGRYKTMITGNCQGAAANMTNFGSVLVYWLMRQGKLPRMQECCTVHDSVYQYTLPKYINIWTVYTIWNILRNPSTKQYFGFQIDDVDMSMDFSIGRTMAEELPFIPLYDYNKMLDPNFSTEEYLAEHKKYKHIAISDYPTVFAKEIKKYEREFRQEHSGHSI